MVVFRFSRVRYTFYITSINSAYFSAQTAFSVIDDVRMGWCRSWLSKWTECSGDIHVWEGCFKHVPVLVYEVQFRYRFNAVKMGLKAMSASTKVSVRTDGEGVLSMNFMIDIDGKNVFIEFRVLSIAIFVNTDLTKCRRYREWGRGIEADE